MVLMDKNSIRKIFLAKRKTLSIKYVEIKSEIIRKKVLEISLIKKCNSILLYLPVYNEVKTELLIKDFMKQKKDIYLPAFFNNEYQIRKFASFEDLETGPYGILQPVDKFSADAENIDLAILPGVAFDLKGTRLGYGKGVFDKLLSKSNAKLIGLAYTFQIVDRLPKEKHDLAMDFVVSEK